MNPNVALLLGVLGLLCLCFEMSRPGAILPGVAGACGIIVSLHAFSLLPIHFAGVALNVLAITLFVVEAAIIRRGIFGIAGIVSMAGGLSMLVDGPSPQLRIHPGIAIAVTLPFAAIFIVLVRLAVAARRRKRVTAGKPVALLALQGRTLQTLTERGKE